MMSVFLKMAGVNAEYFRVIMNYLSTGIQKYARKRIQHDFEGTVQFMEWSHGMESWSGAMEWSFGVDFGVE